MKKIKFIFLIALFLSCLQSSFAIKTNVESGCEGCTGDLRFAFTGFETVPSWNDQACLFPDPALAGWDNFCDDSQTINGTNVVRSLQLTTADYIFGGGLDNYWVRLYAQDLEFCWDETTFNQSYQNGTGDCFFRANDIPEVNCAWTVTIEMMTQCTNNICTGTNNTGVQWKSSFAIGANEFNCTTVGLLGFLSTIELESASVQCTTGANFGC